LKSRPLHVRRPCAPPHPVASDVTGLWVYTPPFDSPSVLSLACAAWDSDRHRPAGAGRGPSAALPDPTSFRQKILLLRPVEILVPKFTSSSVTSLTFCGLPSGVGEVIDFHGARPLADARPQQITGLIRGVRVPCAGLLCPIAQLACPVTNASTTGRANRTKRRMFSR